MTKGKGIYSTCLIIVTPQECVLLSGDSPSAIAKARWDDELGLDAAVGEWIEGLDHRPKTVCFAVTSELCLSCRFTPPSSAMSLSSEAIRFAAEAYLPMAAEDFAAIFHEDQDVVFCVTIARKLLNSLTGRVSAPTRVIPLALLVAAAAMLKHDDGDNQLLTFGYRDRLESLRWHNGVCEWWSEPVGAVDSRFDSTGSPSTETRVDLQFDDQDQGIEHFVAKGIQSVPSARLNAIDLLRDPVLGRPTSSDGDATIQRICQTVVLCAFIAILFLVMRRTAVKDEIHRVVRIQEAVFESRFPGAQPTGINRKLRSELVRRRELTDQAVEWVDQHAGADDVFAKALQACYSIPSLAVSNIEVTGKVAVVEVQGKAMGVGESLQKAMTENGLNAEIESTKSDNGLYLVRLSALTAKETP